MFNPSCRVGVSGDGGGVDGQVGGQGGGVGVAWA